MGNKTKKRLLSESSVAEKAVPNGTNNANKKQKSENKAAVQNGQAKQNVAPSKQNKANKKDKKQASPQASPQKGKGPVKEAAQDATGRKLRFLQKKLEYREKRKQQRAEGVKPASKSNLSAEQIKKKLEEIKSRDTISKTARRKMAALKKKLSILEGGAQEEEKTKTEAPAKGAADSKNKGASKQLQKTEAKSAEAVKRKDEVQSLGPNKKAKGAAKGANKKGKQGDLLLVKKEKAEEEDDEDDDDDEDDEEDVEEEEEVEDEEDDDEDVEAEEEEDEEEDDDDDDEDEEEEDEEEEEEEDEETEEQKAPKKAAVKTVSQKKESPEDGAAKNQKSQHVLYVSNVPYTATVDDIKKHFLTKAGEVTSVKIPTKFGTNTPRGFAYVEFPNSAECEKGLTLNGTTLKDRRISVQYSTSDKNAGNKQFGGPRNQFANRKPGGKFGGNQNRNQKPGWNRNKPNAGPRRT